MTASHTAKRDAAAPFGRSDTRMLSTPLDFIQSEHLRHRELCRAVEELAESVTGLDADLGRAVAEFLETEMVLHVIDEEEDLFPLLRRRLKPADEADRIVGLLSGEHAADEVLAGEIIAGLRAVMATGAGAPGKALRNALLTFADRQRRHLTVENAIILPLAAARLSKRDLSQLARRMAARRGIRMAEGAA